jgi:hypothetical protein
MTLNKIEIDKLEDLHYAGGEANKRSIQFREVAGRLNDAIDEIEKHSKFDELQLEANKELVKELTNIYLNINQLKSAIVGVAVIGLIVIGVIIWIR